MNQKLFKTNREKRLFNEGRKAFLGGKMLSENPYDKHVTANYDALIWALGWLNNGQKSTFQVDKVTSTKGRDRLFSRGKHQAQHQQTSILARVP